MVSRTPPRTDARSNAAEIDCIARILPDVNTNTYDRQKTSRDETASELRDREERGPASWEVANEYSSQLKY